MLTFGLEAGVCIIVRLGLCFADFEFGFLVKSATAGYCARNEPYLEVLLLLLSLLATGSHGAGCVVVVCSMVDAAALRIFYVFT